MDEVEESGDMLALLDDGQLAWLVRPKLRHPTSRTTRASRRLRRVVDLCGTLAYAQAV
jgi:hypothetical protein